MNSTQPIEGACSALPRQSQANPLQTRAGSEGRPSDMVSGGAPTRADKWDPYDGTHVFGAFTPEAVEARRAKGVRNPWPGKWNPNAAWAIRHEWVGKEDALQHDGSLFAFQVGDMGSEHRSIQVYASIRRQLGPYKHGSCWSCSVNHDGSGRLCGECYPKITALAFHYRTHVFRRDHGTCQLCQKAFIETMSGWEIDHIIPMSHGGEHKWDNLRLLCRTCHLGETAKARRSTSPLRHVVMGLENEIEQLKRRLAELEGGGR